MESYNIESVVAAARQASGQYYSVFINDATSQPAEQYVSQMFNGGSAMESSGIESTVAAARQSSELALGQIVDNMAEVSSADAVDQTLELFLNDIVKSTIVADSSEATDGIYQPLLDILA